MNPAEASILQKQEPFRSILLQLQLIIEHTIPEAELLFKWKIPYFYLHGKTPLVYMHTTKNYVDLGFAKGFQLRQHQNILIGEHRNTVKSLRYFSETDIDEKVLVDLLMEAKGLES